MPTDNSTLDKAINLRQLQMAHEDLNSRTVQFQETADPASADVINEYQRVLAALYQALTDAQQVVIPAREAAAMVDAAKGSYDTLEARIMAIEQSAARFGFTASTDPMSLLY